MNIGAKKKWTSTSCFECVTEVWQSLWPQRWQTVGGMVVVTTRHDETPEKLLAVVWYWGSPTEESEVNLIKDGNFFQIEFLRKFKMTEVWNVWLSRHDENPSCQRSSGKMSGAWTNPGTLSELEMMFLHTVPTDVPSANLFWNVEAIEERNRNFGSTRIGT